MKIHEKFRLNLGLEFLEEISRLELCEINFTAATKAQASNAFDASMNYAIKALELLPKDCWNTDLELSYSIHLALAESSYQAMRFEVTEGTLDVMSHFALDSEKLFRINELKLRLCINQGKTAEIEPLFCSTLDALGVGMFVSVPSILYLLGWQQLRLLGKQPAYLTSLPTTNDPQHLLVMEAFRDAQAGYFLLGRKHFIGLFLNMFSYTLRHGNTRSLHCAFARCGARLRREWRSSLHLVCAGRPTLIDDIGG